MEDPSEGAEERELFRSLNPIEAAIRTISLPPNCRITAIAWVPETRTCYAYTNIGPVGEGETIDKALRDAQKRVYDFNKGG